MEIITKYSDYTIQSIEYLISAIEAELEYRDLTGLTNGKIEKIHVTKEHPLVALRIVTLNQNVHLDNVRSSLLPAISVTPISGNDDSFLVSSGLGMGALTDDWIDRYEELYAMDDKNIQEEVLITKTQIELILGAYRKLGLDNIKYQTNKYFKKEEVSVSVWSDFQDLDVLFGNLMDSVLMNIQSGITGDDSRIKNFAFKSTKGLTNFNFGRTLFGTEFSLTFHNEYTNYTIYSEIPMSEITFVPTFQSPGEEAE